MEVDPQPPDPEISQQTITSRWHQTATGTETNLEFDSVRGSRTPCSCVSPSPSSPFLLLLSLFSSFYYTVCFHYTIPPPPSIGLKSIPYISNILLVTVYIFSHAYFTSYSLIFCFPSPKYKNIKYLLLFSMLLFLNIIIYCSSVL